MIIQVPVRSDLSRFQSVPLAEVTGARAGGTVESGRSKVKFPWTLLFAVLHRALSGVGVPDGNEVSEPHAAGRFSNPRTGIHSRAAGHLRSTLDPRFLGDLVRALPRLDSHAEQNLRGTSKRTAFKSSGSPRRTGRRLTNSSRSSLSTTQSPWIATRDTFPPLGSPPSPIWF